MGDGYDKDRENIPSHERGRIFENGCDRYYKDREHGYMRDSRVYEGRDGRMKVDKINIQLGRTIEEKSGEVKSRKDETQLKVVRELIDRGDINHHTLRTVAGEEISRPARELIGGLLRDYPDKFTHQVVSRDDAREIWARGLQREPGQQLEIPEVGQKARQQRDVRRQVQGVAVSGSEGNRRKIRTSARRSRRSREVEAKAA
ncbi:hypothetical protein [Nocardia wallacei]|uniref:hypothetical protein n=1 Tax=Nocardia wallacei TaxID=480035 RepID=UPI002454A286|nr:hypothetical protein [Nocardia wallacei]